MKRLTMLPKLKTAYSGKRDKVDRDWESNSKVSSL